ncbi:MAG: VOC family protein [Hyphomicrobiales bacterium]
MDIESLDHLVLTVASIEASCAFYERVLGMTPERFGDGRTAVRFAGQKINLHEAGREFEPKSRHPTPGSGDLCFIVPDLENAIAHLDRCQVAIEQGPVPRTGARGAMTSVYFRDPDGNLVELAEYD